uniref:ISG15 ubiquitin like modifier n=1 Tax=Sparus aurata TaxID=8175 RepID=A0A671XD06_SPAAU
MDIAISMLNGASHCLMVNPQDTVSSLKGLIQRKLGVSVQEQKLLFVNAQRTPLNDDSKPLSWYGLQSGSQVSLLITQPPPVQVFLRNEKGKSTTYDITPEETVDHFKVRVEKREGFPVSRQRLLHQSREMTTGRLTDYNVTNHSTIHLMLRQGGEKRGGPSEPAEAPPPEHRDNHWKTDRLRRHKSQHHPPDVYAGHPTAARPSLPQEREGQIDHLRYHT